MRYGTLFITALTAGLGLAGSARGTLHFPTEPPLTPEPNLLRFVRDQLNDLRRMAPTAGVPPEKQAQPRLDALAKIDPLLRRREALNAAEAATLGAYLIRVRWTRPGREDRQEARDVLEAAAQRFPRDGAIQANLGTLYHLQGALDLAERSLEQAVALTDSRLEAAHLKLVRLRSRERPTHEPPLDNLFIGLKFVSEKGTWEPGQLAAAERAKLPGGSLDEAIRLVQGLLLSLPDDARLHWLLAELGAARNGPGDLEGAFKAMDTAEWDYKLSTRELHQHRLALKALLDQRGPELPPVPGIEHSTPAPETPSPPPGETTNESSKIFTPQGLAVAALGVMMVGGLFALQVRQWLRRRGRKRAGVA
jgi:hypothetical protein